MEVGSQFAPRNHDTSAPHWHRRKRRSRQLSATLPRIDSWRLTHKVGSGATADVFLAQPIEQSGQTESDYALKTVRQDLEDKSAATKRLIREVRAASSVAHPNLISILCSNFEDDAGYFVMPRLRGATLGQALERGIRFDIPRSIWIARQVAEALGALHAAGWMHLDVKPHNVAADTSGHCTLFDLDLALPAPSQPTCARPSSAACLRGTLSYTAPELFTSVRSAVPASDVYSLGVMMFELLSGVLPFNAATPEQLVTAHREERPPSVRTYTNSVPIRVSRLISQMLSKDPARRPTTSGELQNELMRLEIECFPQRSVRSQEIELAMQAN